MALVIPFASEKGGVGKTTSVLSIATWIHYVFSLKVAVFDCDPSENAFLIRKSHLAYFDNLKPTDTRVKYALEFIEKHNRPIYPIFEKVNSETFSADLEKHGDQYDIIFVDMPGYLDVNLLNAVLPLTDHLFIPYIADLGSMNGTKDFALVTYNEGAFSFQGHYYMAKSYPSTQLVDEVKDAVDLLEKLPIPYTVMKNNIMHRIEVMKPMAMISIFPLDGSSYRDHYLAKFCFEFLEKIGYKPLEMIPFINLKIR